MGSQPHVLVIPYPAQGHVAPLMKFSHQIVDHGIKVTIVSPEFIHERLKTTMPMKSPIRLVSFPDGLEPGDDRNDKIKLINSFLEVLPGHFKDLIEKINESDDEHISCVITDGMVVPALEVAEKMGIKMAVLWPAGPATLAIILSIPKLIQDGIIDTRGTPLKNELIWLSKEIAAWTSTKLPWSCPGESKRQEVLFGHLFRMNHFIKQCNWLLSNSFYELDSLALNLIPEIMPIGPLLLANQSGSHIGSFWPEDSTCLSWLDKQPVDSVIYASFGSTSKFNQQQLDELALGLENIGLPFLWVFRSDIINEALSEFLDGFRTRIADRGMIVNWAPQEHVLAHPSTACFLSHCGWNSTLDGISMGVPFLCWPYFTDQFQNKSYICDVWKVGLGLNPDENGIITRHEINTKIKTLLFDDGIKTSALKLKEMAKKSVTEGGSSFKNFESFIEKIKH
ncbi:UDP-glycosyltransferase 83A1-like [Quercus lobata]|uniref:UDP-glycosyltransferase n=1 Tax=Quercus lobata TaxID=97700 RepID=A0A7N2MQ32_QUELO|nr:UDP-glycosyltransferase 83A1-like [Quercus lobata]